MRTNHNVIDYPMNLQKIVITGGYACGKSSASRMLHHLLPSHLVSADAICKRQMAVGATGWQQLRKAWDDSFFLPDGSLDRAYTRKVIFQDLAKKKELENILHPLVFNQLLCEAQRASDCNKHLLVEIPLFFESQQSYTFDRVLVVAVEEDIAIIRAMQRDGISEDLAQRIIAHQMPLAQKKEKADFIIDNSGLLVSAYSQLALFAQQIQQGR